MYKTGYDELTFKGVCTHTTALWPVEQSSILSAKFDCPVALQNFSHISIAISVHDCEIMAYYKNHLKFLVYECTIPWILKDFAQNFERKKSYTWIMFIPFRLWLYYIWRAARKLRSKLLFFKFYTKKSTPHSVPTLHDFWPKHPISGNQILAS